MVSVYDCVCVCASASNVGPCSIIGWLAGCLPSLIILNGMVGNRSAQSLNDYKGTRRLKGKETTTKRRSGKKEERNGQSSRKGRRKRNLFIQMQGRW